MKLVERMMKAEFYPHEVKDIQMIQTHTAWVFLTGSRAYKVKKPVNFGFLDFSTLEKRAEFCEREVELNRELSDLYIGVEPITLDSKGNPRLGGKVQDAVEYAVVMKELPQKDMMSVLLGEGKVSYETIDKLSSEIAEFHKKAKTSRDITSEGSLKSVRFNWEENFTQTENVRDVTIPAGDFDFIKNNIDRFLAENEKAFRLREKKGMIRYCHGDLHSGNIFVTEDKIQIFDRIEFNLRFACSDTIADLAFMTMDLDYHSRRNLADFLLDRYLDITGDWEGLRFHDFFRCYRAYVRGKVTGFMLAQNPPNPEEISDKARSYFSLAKVYATTLFSKPKLIVFYGLPGTGKTFMSARTRDWTNAVHLRSDVVRREAAGMSLNEHHYADYGKELYSPGMSKKVYALLRERAGKYLSNGKSLVLDATYNKAEERSSIYSLARELGAGVHFIKCNASDDDVKSWIEQRKERDKLSDATWDIYARMKQDFEPEGDFSYHQLKTGRNPSLMDADVRRILSRGE